VAKTKYAEWLALIERRIVALQSNGTSAPTLTMQQADALAGEWYRQYVAAREAEPGDAVGWADALSNAEAVLAGDRERDFKVDVDSQVPRPRVALDSAMLDLEARIRINQEREC
jgi:hypothetical protein